MRYVNRTGVAVPPSLATPSTAVQTEKDEAITFYRAYDTTLTPKPAAYDFKQYKGYDVTVALRKLFHGKCAYCESEVGDNLDVEHFRPKGSVSEDPRHPGYWWLAHSWGNLLPSCTPCNQKRRQHLVTELMSVEELTALQAKKPTQSYGKADQFPVAGARATYGQPVSGERPYLIDPTEEDPEVFLLWSHTGPYSVVLANPGDQWSTQRALTTISVFALNRMHLVQTRSKILNHLRFQAEQVIEDLEQDMAEGGSPRLVQRAIRRVEEMRRLHSPESPYSGMTKAFVDKFENELLTRIGR
ncbi:HNH endonuclease family protein [Pseudomonas marginalis]|uniref:hypothetical protein n=1 Tax=Pseudomonas marginalis TaxID=298 RepID=UPI002A36E034|nr:hypothetical protein [Pseudomonas marginalis]WPN23947.1 hypothetical protein QMK57_00925 [Pseudomonas marginalis]